MIKGLVTANGCFDGLKPWHMFLLGFCRAQGPLLVVGINTDDYIRKHKRPYMRPQEKRAQDLMDLGFIQSVEIFPEDDPSAFIRRHSPEIHCIGEEYRDKAPELKVCRELDIKVVYVPRVGKWSSSILE